MTLPGEIALEPHRLNLDVTSMPQQRMLRACKRAREIGRTSKNGGSPQESGHE